MPCRIGLRLKGTSSSVQKEVFMYIPRLRNDMILARSATVINPYASER